MRGQRQRWVGGRGNCHKRRRGGGLASYRGIFPDIIKLVVPRETRVKVTAVENAQESTNKLYNKFFFKTVREIIILFTKILSLSLSEETFPLARNTYTLQQRIAKRRDLEARETRNLNERKKERKKKRRGGKQKQLVCFEDNVAYSRLLFQRG